MTDVPIETVNAPIAIPITASFIGDKSLLETSFDNSNATIVDAAIDPVNVPNGPIATIPVKVAVMKIVAPPPTPNRFGSPNGLRVESCIRTPASPRQAPATRLTAILGNRMLQIMVSEKPSLSDATRLPQISFAPRLLGPANNPIAMSSSRRVNRQAYLIQ